MAKELIFKSFREYGEYCKKQPWYGVLERQVKCDISRQKIDRDMRDNRCVGYQYKVGRPIARMVARKIRGL